MFGFNRLFRRETGADLLKLALVMLLLLANVPLPASAQILGAPNSFLTQIGGQNKDHVDFTGGTIAGVTISSPTITGATVTGGTYSSPTITTPTITGGTITGATITATISPSTVRTSSSVTANSTTTYADVTGLTGTVVPGTYKFTAFLPSTVASGTGGIKYGLNYTGGAVLSAMESSARGYTASAVAVQHSVSTTTQADLFTQAAVVIFVEIEGTFVVSTGGTVTVQVAQNTSNASNTVALLGGSLQLIRIA